MSRSALAIDHPELFILFFVNGRSQGKYVEEKLGKNYPHRCWGMPLLLGIAAMVAYFILAAGNGERLYQPASGISFNDDWWLFLARLFGVGKLDPGYLDLEGLVH